MGSSDPPVLDSLNATAAGARRRWRHASFGQRTLRVIEWLAIAVTVLWALDSILVYGKIARATVAYPYHLGWMEGGTVEVVQRVRDGESLYREPSLEYVPYLYTPLYFWVTAAFSCLFGVDFFVARLVSLLSISGCCVLVYRFVRRESASRSWALLAVGLFAATYEASGRWFHLARVDSLALLLLLWSLYLLRFRRSAILAGLLLWLAYLAKQSSLLTALPVLAVMVVTDTKRALTAGVTATALFGASIVVGDLLTDGWYSYFTIRVGQQHQMLWTMITGFWEDDMKRFAVALAIGMSGLAYRVALGGQAARTASFYAAMLAGTVCMAWVSRIHSGGWINVDMPAHAAIAIVMSIGAGALSSRAREGDRPLGRVVVIGLCVAACVQLYKLRYDENESYPPADALEVGNRYLTELAAIEGDVLVLNQRWVQKRAGKHSYGLGMAAMDLFRSRNNDDVGRRALMDSMGAAIQERRFSAIIDQKSVSGSAPWPLQNLTSGSVYRFERLLTSSPDPVTGPKLKPSSVWRPVPTGPSRPNGAAKEAREGSGR